MKLSRLLGLVTAGAILATPLMAQAQAVSPASSLSVAGNSAVRAGAPMKNANKLGGNSLWIIGAIALVAGVTWAIVDDDDDDDVPVSN
ncbi:MAG: hypothetical protein ACREB5_02970 [Sphingomonadaceae bacterium]